jgi:hypothetical protein
MAGFSENHNHRHKPKLLSTYLESMILGMDTGVQRGAPTPAAAKNATPATQRRGIDAALTLETAAAVEKACGFFGTTAPLRMPPTPPLSRPHPSIALAAPKNKTYRKQHLSPSTPRPTRKDARGGNCSGAYRCKHIYGRLVTCLVLAKGLGIARRYVRFTASINLFRSSYDTTPNV